MIQFLGQSDFKVMPWANGRGQTVELCRVERDGALLWRLSRAAVVEDGPFSTFPGIDRILVVLDGPGFDLVGEVDLRAAPLVPVAFAGEASVRAAGVLAPSEDFNVMVRRGAVEPDVAVMRGGIAAGAIFAVEPMRVAGRKVARFDLVLAERPVDFDGLAIVVNGLPQR